MYNYFPAGYQQYPQAYPQNNGITWVQGIEGAKAHPVSAGQTAFLMDSESDSFFLKSADQTGMPTLRVFDYTERKSQPVPATYVTREDLSQFATKKDLEEALSELKAGLEGEDE